MTYLTSLRNTCGFSGAVYLPDTAYPMLAQHLQVPRESAALVCPSGIIVLVVVPCGLTPVCPWTTAWTGHSLVSPLLGVDITVGLSS